MPLNIKDAETERLAREVAATTGDSKTGAIRIALRERRQLRRYLGLDLLDRLWAMNDLDRTKLWPWRWRPSTAPAAESTGAGRPRRQRADLRDLIAARGAPDRIIAAWQVGAFDLVVSPLLLAEVRRALTYPKLERLVSPTDADAYASWLSRGSEMAADPAGPPLVHCDDPRDEYLISLAAAERAVLVCGDIHLTSLAPRIPVRSPAAFLTDLEASP